MAPPNTLTEGAGSGLFTLSGDSLSYDVPALICRSAPAQFFAGPKQ
jgi:hypothetical protein